MDRLIKTATWTCLAFSITALTTYCVTGDFLKAGIVALICRAIKIPTYYFHDLAWDRHWQRRDQLISIDIMSDLTQEEIAA